MSFYDTCLLITKDGDINFGVIGFQTNDTFNIRTEVFMNKKEVEIIEVKFKTKSQIMLETGVSRNFNSCCITIEDEAISII